MWTVAKVALFWLATAMVKERAAKKRFIQLSYMQDTAYIHYIFTVAKWNGIRVKLNMAAAKLSLIELVRRICTVSKSYY